MVLRGSDRTLLPDSRSAGPVDSSQVVDLTVRVRSKGDLDELESRTYEQALRPPSDREYLTHDELAAQYGANTRDLDAIEAFTGTKDLVVVHRSAEERSMALRGQLRDLLAAFPTDIRMYHHAIGTYRGRQGQILIPQELDELIVGIFGFDTRPKRRTRHNMQRLAFNGPSDANGVAATYFADRYQFPTESETVQLDGSGQTVAIIELGGGFRRSDLAEFFQEIGGKAPAVTAVSIDRTGNDPTTPQSADGEVMLDIEVAGAVVPGAQFLVYFAPNSGDKGFVDAISAAIHDSQRKPGVVSISWGEPEDGIDAQGIQQYHELFVEAASLGITVCAASGDHGTADEDAVHWDKKVHVNHPTSDPFVLGCGGTQIEDGQDVVWNDGTPFDPSVQGGGGWASGGGISTVFPVPDYQMNANLPKSIDSDAPGRGVPDIAMSATDYYTRVDRSEGASGGTSAVAPLMAALIARLGQAEQKTIGFLNPLLYQNVGKDVCRDVTTGTNAIAHTVNGYEAGPGWDACTGLGTPDGTTILNVL